MDDFLRDPNDPGLEPLTKGTGALLFRLMTIAFLVPAVASAVIWSWSYFQGMELTNKHIRLSCMVIWLLTMVTLAVAAIGGRHGKSGRRLKGRRRNPLALAESMSPLEKWEQRSSRSLLFEICGAVIGIPLAAFFIVAVYFHAEAGAIPPKGIKTILPILWIGGLGTGIWLAVRSTRRQLLYSQESRRTAERERDLLGGYADGHSGLGSSGPEDNDIA